MNLSFESSICIVVPCRDVALWLVGVLANIEALLDWFPRSQVIFFENDSKDDTRKILAAWCDQKPWRELIVDTLNATYPHRSLRLAEIRNRLLVAARNSGAEWMLSVDADDVFAMPIARDRVAAAFGAMPADVVAATSLPGRPGDVCGYYDVWALRVPGVLETDCWHEFFRYRCEGLTDAQAYQKTIGRYENWVAEQDKPFVVNSAFNAAAFHRLSSVQSCCKFVGALRGGSTVCEWVPFNACIRSHGGKIMVAPQFQMSGRTRSR